MRLLEQPFQGAAAGISECGKRYTGDVSGRVVEPPEINKCGNIRNPCIS